MPSWYPAKVVVRSRLTAPLGPIRPAQAAAGCVLTTKAATSAAAPAMNRLIPSSSFPAMAGWRYDDGTARRFRRPDRRGAPATAAGRSQRRLGEVDAREELLDLA